MAILKGKNDSKEDWKEGENQNNKRWLVIVEKKEYND